MDDYQEELLERDVLSQDMISRTRIWRMLRGYRDHPPADLGAIVDVLTRVSQIAVEHPEIAL